MLPVALFEDRPAHSCLSPLDDLRPACNIRTGVLTTLERACLRLDVRALLVPETLRPLTLESLALHPQGSLLGVNDRSRLGAGPCLLLNARAPLAWKAALTLKPGQCLTDATGLDLLAAIVAPDRIDALLAGDRTGLSSVPAANDASSFVLTRPWHLRAQRDAAIAEDLALLCGRHRDAWGWPSLPVGTLRAGTDDVLVHESADIGLGCILDSASGPIFIGPHASIRHGAVLIGPCAVLDHATVLDRAVIRPHTVIGPWCKASGEIGGSIMQGYSNKAHDGYLGDSYVGEWVNLGAGTTVSNLLNTYGEIVARAAPHLPNERTGQMFLGPIIGDHVKAAIGTRLMTGSIIHTGSMIATTAAASGCVPAFSWCTDEARRPYRLDKFVEVMRAAMARRKVEPGPAYLATLTELHARSASARS